MFQVVSIHSTTSMHIPLHRQTCQATTPYSEVHTHLQKVISTRMLTISSKLTRAALQHADVDFVR
jgi:hypothetical protein